METTSIVTRVISTTTTIVAIVLLALLIAPQGARARDSSNKILVVVTNNHTSYLSLRCFSFDNSFSVQHLNRDQPFKFYVTVRTIFPSATMFNCSTNMGTFVAFKHDYTCSTHESKTCNWRFDESMTYLQDPNNLNNWLGIEYNPNYESLNRGGVIKGYFVNK